ncbi:MAG: phosphoribosyltransferase [Ignavibacteria bacterium]|jgi:putative phosphoribosyl transferase
MRFRDRNDAAQKLIPLLDVYKRHHGVVLGIPRGGIPIAQVLAGYLEWDFAPLFVKKLTHPDNQEYAIGAVSLQGAYVDPAHAMISREYVRQEIERQRRTLKQRMKKYDIQPVSLQHQVAMLVDDGIATGQTMRYAVEVVRLEVPRCIVVVSPVASMDAVRMLRPIVEDLIVLHTPQDLGAIGDYYDSFEPVTDSEAMHSLSLGLYHEQPNKR